MWWFKRACTKDFGGNLSLESETDLPLLGSMNTSSMTPLASKSDEAFDQESEPALIRRLEEVEPVWMRGGALR